VQLYPLKFEPLYVPKIWGGRNLARLFGRDLPAGEAIGESWELADLPEAVSVISNGPLTGMSLTQLTADAGSDLLGPCKPMADGRFPLLLKLLDANDILSLQVHPDTQAVAQIGPPAALKTECWYCLESREGVIYRGVKAGVTADQFREAIETDTVEQLVISEQLADGDFRYLPAGMVHALGAGLVVAEVQTPSDTTYRVTDWGRGREIHTERSLQCIHFSPPDNTSPGCGGDMLLVTDYFSVAKRRTDSTAALAEGRCSALMILSAPAGGATVNHAGLCEPDVSVQAGDTILLPAALQGPSISADGECEWLEVTLPNGEENVTS